MRVHYPKTAIIYWGVRGGGQVLAKQLLDEAYLRNLSPIYFSRPIRNDGTGRPIPIYYIFHWFAARRQVVRNVLLENIQVVVFPMASPWDICLGRSFIRRGLKVTRIIHDASPHPGDIFPPQIWIRLLCHDAINIVTLSNYVSKELLRRKFIKQNVVSVGKLPTIKNWESSPATSIPPQNNFLFIGRGRKYKGLSNLLLAWPSVGDENTHLTIAGEGHKVPSSLSRITHIDKWLSDDEVLSLIKHSQVVVLPYGEASQSGLIPIAHAFMRPVVITPVGGLTEQIEDGIDGLVSKDLKISSLVETMNLAIHHNFDFRSQMETQSISLLIDLCVS